MGSIYSKTYIDDLHTAVSSVVGADKLYGKAVMITGAAGLIGSYMTDMLLLMNRERGSDITVYALSKCGEDRDLHHL